MAVGSSTLIIIGGTEVYVPSGYKVYKRSLDSANSVRNESGVFNRDRIRAEVYTIELKFDNITQLTLKSIADLIVGASFSVEFFDPRSTPPSRNATMYAGDESFDMVNSHGSLSDKRWTYSFNLIEY